MTKLDTLQSTIGELVVARLQQESMNEELRALGHELDELQRNWRAVASELRELRDHEELRWQRLDGRVAAHSSRVRGLQQRGFSLSKRSAVHTAQLGLLSLVLEERLQNIRMLPLGPFFESFGVTLRELGRGLGKQVRLEVREHGIEVDRLVLERLREPLLHLLRNAIAHGIETPDQRLREGKSECGLVCLGAQFEGDRVSIRVSDDGRGIDRRAVLEAGRGRGFVRDDVRELDDAALLDVLCRPGFTTTTQADETSGRGVGLDAVFATVVELHGSMAIEPVVGGGTCFVITVPAALKTAQGLIVSVGPHEFAIRVDAIDRVVRIAADDIVELEGLDVLFVDGEPISWTSLAALLGVPTARTHIEQRQPTLILRVGNVRLALSVDDVPGEVPLVIKPLGRQFVRTPQFSGAAIRADGSVLVVLEPRELLRLAVGGPAPRAAVEVSQPELAVTSTRGGQRTILVVDDSITTRTLERNILEGAGYRVLVAIDGEQALDALRREDAIDMVVTDIQMPRMDGLELCRKIRAGARPDLPVVIVTSLGDEREQLAGLEAGADAYIIKANFQQDHLLATIQRLVGTPP